MNRREFLRKVRVRVKESGLPTKDAAAEVAAEILDKYTLENIALGKIRPGERAPIGDYIRNMGLDCNTYILRRKLSRKYITAGGNVADVSVEDCVRTFLRESLSDFDDIEGYIDELSALFQKVVAVPEEEEDCLCEALREDQKRDLRKLLIGIKNGKITERSRVYGYLPSLDVYPFGDIIMSPITRKLQVTDMHVPELELSALMLTDFMNITDKSIFTAKLKRFYDFCEA